MTGALFLKQEFKKLQKLPKCQKTCLLNNLKVYVGIDSWLILKITQEITKEEVGCNICFKVYKEKNILERKNVFLE